ncbi:MAG: hypothetical protein IKK23_07545, partial [Bacteroidales bacterium]|nr:hypothetical protein [Bacteroidales bacterium]
KRLDGDSSYQLAHDDPEPLSSTVFKTAAIDHSATSPIPPRLLWDCKGRHFFLLSNFFLKIFTTQ